MQFLKKKWEAVGIFTFFVKPQDGLKWTTQKMIEMMKNNG